MSMAQKVLALVSLFLAIPLTSQTSPIHLTHHRHRLSSSSSQQERICGTTILSKSRISIKEILQNHSTCLFLVPVNYRVCLQLLEDSLQCNAMVYTNSRCTLYQRGGRGGDQQLQQPPMKKLVYNEKVHEITHSQPSLHFHLLDVRIDNCIPPPPLPSRPPLPSDGNRSAGTLHMNQCLSDQTTHLYRVSPSSWDDWIQLPLLGIVMAVTQDWMTGNKYEMDRVTDHWNCYANTHNYTFHLHIMENMSRNRFYHLRHPSIVSHFLHKYRYLLILDADNLVVNLSRSLDHLLTTSSHLNVPDLFFHMREGGEVTASTYIIKNSLYSRCFIYYWRSLAPSDDLQSPDHWIPTPNHDNGDLVVAIMNLINSSALLECSKHITTHFGADFYDNGQLLCFRLFRGALAQIRKYVPNIEIFFIREGFFRMHLGHIASHDPTDSSLMRKDVACHENDIIAHGWKQIGTVFWNDTKCNILDYHLGNGRNPICHWLPEEEEREIVVKKCFWRSPMCLVDQQNSCLQSSTCDAEKFNLQRWELCIKYHHCDPYLTFRKFQSEFQPIYSLQQPWE